MAIYGPYFNSSVKKPNTELVTGRWSKPENFSSAKAWPINSREIPFIIDVLYGGENILLIKYRPPKGDTLPPDIIWNPDYLFAQDVYWRVPYPDKCSVTQIIPIIEADLEDDDIVSIELTENQLAFIANLLGVDLNNRINKIFLKEECL